MKKAVKIFAFALSLIMLFSFAGCGKKAERILYNIDLEDYVTVGEYEGLEVDTSSDEYKEYYAAEIDNDIYYYDLYNTLTEGKVADGDTANIDYVGKKDGVAFDGGTAEGYDLVIGSDSFIDGFEDGLIGVDIGTTVDLDLTFPENYDNTELAGAQVVFTVTVNSVKRAMEPAEYYSKLDFKSEKEYLSDVEKRAAQNCLISLLGDAEVKEYPQADVELMQPYLMNQIDNMYQQNYGMTLESYFSYTGQTEEEFKELLNEQQLYPMMESQMALYYVLDDAKLSVGDEEIDAEIKKILSYDVMEGVTEEKLTELYGRYYFEALAVENAVKEHLYKNAVIK